MALEKSGNCWYCGTELTTLDYGRADTCRQCGRDTKTCKGCEHYDSGSNNECRENQAERVLDKERSNFCDYFRPRAGTGSPGTGSRNSAKAAAEALFKKK
ncbi:MAG: hypothetical protein NDJ90_02770 [Oligoflexia bacterium]|nr:hypothetical protein [Oligoflexia bacterium]